MGHKPEMNHARTAEENIFAGLYFVNDRSNLSLNARCGINS